MRERMSFYMYENVVSWALSICPSMRLKSELKPSKAANPVFHRAMEKFIAAVSGKPFKIINPFVFLTKAQALRQAQVGKFGVSLAETFSCDRFPDWREGRLRSVALVPLAYFVAYPWKQPTWLSAI